VSLSRRWRCAAGGDSALHGPGELRAAATLTEHIVEVISDSGEGAQTRAPRGVCGRELPEECRFPESTAATIETIMRIEKERHRTWLRRASAD
jgi:hypothetical protein